MSYAALPVQWQSKDSPGGEMEDQPGWVLAGKRRGEMRGHASNEQAIGEFVQRDWPAQNARKQGIERTDAGPVRVCSLTEICRPRSASRPATRARFVPPEIAFDIVVTKPPARAVRFATHPARVVPAVPAVLHNLALRVARWGQSSSRQRSRRKDVFPPERRKAKSPTRESAPTKSPRHYASCFGSLCADMLIRVCLVAVNLDRLIERIGG